LQAPPIGKTAKEEKNCDSTSNGLYPHQVDGIKFLTQHGRAILADDMGLGKTRQAVIAMNEAAPNGVVLVICPASHLW
jgi:SNF2 family DNA or RNA helicase